MVKRGNRGSEGKISTFGLSPFQNSIYRALWIASFFSYVGAAMNDVGASWLMTSIAPNPLLVSLITTASALPIFLFALPSGALSDIFDRRNILLITCVYMLTISTILGILTLVGIITPTILLILTFALGAGTTMIRTPIIPTMSGLVSRMELPAALTLSAVAANIGRAIGPSIGGFIVGAIAPWAVFFLNSVSFIGMILVLIRVPKKSELEENSHMEENIIEAIRAQIRYVPYSQAAHVLIVRAGLFVICGSAILSLLPVLAKHVLGLSSTGFGLLLGAFGAGGVVGGLVILPKLRQMISVESLITGSTVLLALSVFLMAVVREFSLICIVMGLGGVAWITIFSNLYVTGLKSAPKWIGARILAVYLLIINGGLAIGSVIWGLIANLSGISITLMLASLALVASILARRWYKTTVVNDLDLTPSMHWPLPQLATSVSPDDGPVLVQIEYLIDISKSNEFKAAITEFKNLRLRDGATNWGIFYDVGNPDHYIETFIADSWAEHLRYHERFTRADKEIEDRVLAFHIGKAAPKVNHFIYASVSTEK